MPSRRPSASAVRAARELRIAVGRLRRRLLDVGRLDALTPSQTSVLSRLIRGEADSASSLAAVEKVRPQSIATILTALEGFGLIERRPDPNDGRRQIIAMTATGRKQVEGSRQAREEWLTRELDTRFTEDERATILAALELFQRLT